MWVTHIKTQQNVGCRSTSGFEAGSSHLRAAIQGKLNQSSVPQSLPELTYLLLLLCRINDSLHDKTASSYGVKSHIKQVASSTF